MVLSRCFGLFAGTLFGLVALLGRAEPGENGLALSVECSKELGEIRPLNGGNCGPIQGGGLVDLSAYLRELKMPYARLHDCHWPITDVVDIHTIFANFDADASRPESYDFRRTDDYLQSIADIGSGIVYRLGESIEHTKRKYYVHPPKDYDKWAAICLSIIAHCNEEWAGGSRCNIKYWEIWNEPENRPSMWSGTDEDYFKLYETTARAIKKRWPELKVGGPSLGYTGNLANGKFQGGELLIKFIERCKDRSIPLDFLSWHLYTDNPAECVVRANGIRALLDQNGFTETELHFNEWNYLPDNDWSPLGLKGQGEPRERFFEKLGSAKSAAFAACVLLNLQNSPVNVANYYMSDTNGFGLFTTNGVPRKTYYSFKAFRYLLETPLRVDAAGSRPSDCCICAGLNRDKSELRILIANYRFNGQPLTLQIQNIPWSVPSNFELFVVDDKHNLASVRHGVLSGEKIDLTGEISAGTVGLIKIQRSK